MRNKSFRVDYSDKTILMFYELVILNSQLEELRKRAEELKKLRDDYEWKPELINNDYNDGIVAELTVVGEQKVKVTTKIMDVTGLRLSLAKDLVDAAPSIIKENISRDEAEYIKRIIESDCQGAKVTVK